MPLFIAGGAVLRALTAARDAAHAPAPPRTHDWWGADSDLDLFVHAHSAAQASRIAQRLKKTRCTVGHVDQRIRKEKHDQQNPLNTKKADKKGIHRSLDVFPEWMIQSEAFEEVDKLIKLNRLDNA